MSFTKSRGVSIMEILVTVLILAVGLLGVAALQISSINNNQSGYFRSQASAIGADISSRVKAAKMAFYGGNINSSNIITAYQGAPYSCDSGVTSCESGSCTEDELATFDKWQVCNFAANELPDGEVYVVNSSGTRLRVAVAWTPVATREDLGQGDISEFINSECLAVGVVDSKDCVIFEVIP